MPIDSVRVRNFRSIGDSGVLALGPVTLLVGENNAGKSSLLRAIYMLQAGGRTEVDDIRIGSDQATVQLNLNHPLPPAVATALKRDGVGPVDGPIRLVAFRDHETGGASVQWPTTSQRASRSLHLSAQRPEHLMVPFFSRRKSMQYESAVRRDLAREVDITDRNLTSRIAELSTASYAAGRRYRELVHAVLGLEVSTFLTDDGQVPGQAVAPDEGIALTRMGEGVSSAVGILTEIAASGRRLFLIEEPETDLHPHALRRMLDVISAAARDGHQFLITTHNDVVLRSLGALADARIYRVEAGTDDNDLPLSSYRELNDSIDREEALLDLGYEQTSPFGWLLLEEASGETFVRDVLIPIFVPRLAILRTVSANGAGNLAKRLEGLHSMLLFAHLSGESHRAWVIADGDQAGNDAVSALRERFTSWPADRFRTHARVDIEDFYPTRFADDVAAIASEGDGRRQKALKGALARKVRDWATGNESAEAELSHSADELLHLLRDIERSVVLS